MKVEYKYTDEDLTAEFIAYKMRQWRDDPFLWMCEQVYTIDESDLESPVKTFPAYRYLKEIIDEYRRSKVMVLCKARRMMATHLGSALMMHAFLFVPYSENIIVSINEERAKKVIQSRCKEIYNYLDKRFPYPVLREKEHIMVSQMINPVIGSTLTALPSGSDKCRGLTITNAFYDEFAFQKNCDENLKALKPALEGDNCRAMIVSTPRFGTKFQELVSKVAKDADISEVMQGLNKTKNELNQTVLSLHYTADPSKRLDTWYHRERFGATPNGDPIPGASGVDSFTWEQEYELSFSVPTGKPVVPEFDKVLHCEPYKNFGGYIKDKPLHIGVDLGTHFPAAVFFQADSLNRCIIHGGLMAEDEELENFLVRIRDYISQEFPECEDNFQIYADPAGSYSNSQGTAPPAVDIMQRFFKKKVYCKKSKPSDRARGIRRKFGRKVGEGMGVIINPSAGTHIRPNGEERHGIMVDALESGWVYKQPKEGEHHMGDDPKKDGYYDHLMDAWGYGMIFVFPMDYEKAVEFRTRKQPERKRRKVRYI